MINQHYERELLRTFEALGSAQNLQSPFLFYKYPVYDRLSEMGLTSL